MMKKKNTAFVSTTLPFLRLSLAMAFIIFCIFCYEMSLKTYNREHQRLGFLLRDLEQEHAIAILKNTNLHLHINSQSDPAWVELTLIKGLGLFPEGHQKVIFTRDTL